MSNIQEIELTPDEEVIKACEHLLELAETGKLQSIGAIMSFPNYQTGNLWAGMEKNNMAIVGECAVLQQELIDNFVERRLAPVFESELD